MPIAFQVAPTIDEVVVVGANAAIAMARRLAREEEMLGGSSAGATGAAAQRVGARLAPPQAVVALIPDSGPHSLSTDLSEQPDHS
jgi:cysteine synthase